jgi:hypothetical protein
LWTSRRPDKTYRLISPLAVPLRVGYAADPPCHAIPLPHNKA